MVNSSALDALEASGNGIAMVISLQNVRVRFPEVDVLHEVESSTTEVVQFGGAAMTQEVIGMLLSCCCTSGRLSR